MGCFVVEGLVLTSMLQGPSAIAELLVLLALILIFSVLAKYGWEERLGYELLIVCWHSVVQ